MTQFFIFQIFLALGLGYALGSIPFGLLLTRLAGYGDIRKTGSGNIGATNVLRTGSKALAALTLILDGGKGAAAVLLAAHVWGIEPSLWAGIGSLIGHVFPVWLRFKGGKGVATILGILLAMAWPVGVISCGLWLLTAFIFRFSSLAALFSIALSPVAMWGFAGPRAAVFVLGMAVLVIGRHHQNIRRLIRGQEPKIGQKK